jgi:hypothetical protein
LANAIPDSVLRVAPFFKSFDDTALYDPNQDVLAGNPAALHKLLAEAVPPLSGAAGFFQSTTIIGTNKCFDLNNLPFKDANLWPATRPGKSAEQQVKQRWLHGDYKDPAYLLTHCFYDKITELTN